MPNSRRVAIVTRMSTQNAGNEALSKHVIAFLDEDPRVGELRALDRYPRQLDATTFRTLRRNGPDLAGGFDKVAQSLIDALHPAAAQPLAPIARVDEVKLDRTARELTGPLRSLKRKIALRQRLAVAGLIEKDRYQAAVNTCAWADLFVWNPAGEFHPTGVREQPMRLMLLVRIAQLLGKKTAIINHSIEIADPELREVTAHVYSKADLVSVRDPQSVKEALSLGVPANKVAEAADLVFLSSESPPPAQQTSEVPVGAIGLSINGREALVGTDEWDRLIEGLRELGRPLVFISNAMNHDLDFARALAARHPIQVVERQPSHEELRALYSRLSLLISSRLHAAILALSVDVPVVSLEPQLFKLTAIFDQLEYPIRTASLRESGWSGRLLTSTRTALAERSALSVRGRSALAAQAERIRVAYEPLFELAGGIGPLEAQRRKENSVRQERKNSD